MTARHTRGRKLGLVVTFSLPQPAHAVSCIAGMRNAGGAGHASLRTRAAAVQVLQPSTVHTRPALTTEHSPARWPAGQRAALPYHQEKLAIATVKGPDL